MSMAALNAVESIRQVNVRSHQPTSTPMSENPDHNLLIQVLDSPPVTPVKADRFENLLAGYNPAPKTLLVDTFRNGFRISYISELSSFESPEIVSAKLRGCLCKIRPLILLRKFDFLHKLGFRSPYLVNH